MNKSLLEKPSLPDNVDEAESGKNEKSETGSLSFLSVTSVAAYLVCSCFMLLINKAAMMFVGGFGLHLVALQILMSSVIIFGCAATRILKEETSVMLSFKAMRPWFFFAVTWVTPMVFNMKALQHLHADVIILFRAATTLAVAVGDFFLYSHKFTWSELGGIALITAGCITFALDNLHASTVGCLWALGYYVTLTFNTLYAKGVFNNHPGVSAWLKTFYCNTIAFVPIAIIATSLEDTSAFFRAIVDVKPLGAMNVVLSCVMGLLIGATGNICRHMLSATGFDIAGNVNKFVTIFLSQMIFGYVLTARANFGAIIALTGATVYSNSVSNAIMNTCC
uniref:Gdp-mannose transporter gonst3-like n=1 Tax=Tetraselmis sp. GSL018 TaxID=582737 RepID=A0A061QUU4_9CHLO|mmetsp:Transcript_11247/g.26666  ORF Transcript_11247/g.26666 Transcript_11247/m.26666 type:complete len:336 (-) Transcript_11247:235-1242(-)